MNKFVKRGLSVLVAMTMTVSFGIASTVGALDSDWTKDDAKKLLINSIDYYEKQAIKDLVKDSYSDGAFSAEEKEEICCLVKKSIVNYPDISSSDNDNLKKKLSSLSDREKREIFEKLGATFNIVE